MLPALAIGGGATLASMFLNNMAQNSVDEARNAVIQAERGRQAGFDAETGKLNDQSLGRYGSFGDKQATTATTLAELFKTPIVTPNTQYTAAPLPPTTSDLTSREIANKNGIAQAYLDHQGDTMAELRSFGDLMGRTGLAQAHDAQAVGQIGGFKKGSSQVERLELDNANRAGNTAKMWADISAGIGKVGLTAGLSGAMDPVTSLNADGSIAGAFGPTSVGGAPLAGLPAGGPFATGASPFLRYGR